jgi:hypothetical protein
VYSSLTQIFLLTQLNSIISAQLFQHRPIGIELTEETMETGPKVKIRMVGRPLSISFIEINVIRTTCQHFLDFQL